MSIRILYALVAAGTAIALRPAAPGPEAPAASSTAGVFSFHSGAEPFDVRIDGIRAALAGEVLELAVVVRSRSEVAERVALQLELPPGLVLESRDVVVRGTLGATMVETAPRAEISGHVVLDLRDAIAPGEERRYEFVVSCDAAARIRTSVQARFARFAANGRIDRMTVTDAYEFLELGPSGILPQSVADLTSEGGSGDDDPSGHLVDVERAGRPVANVNVRTVIDPRASSSDPFAAHGAPIGHPFHDLPDPR